MQLVDCNTNYESINEIISKYTFTALDKINVYGVITFIGSSHSTKANCISVPITIVDKSCTLREKLKIVVFSTLNDVHTINNSCEIGDIIRFHRLRVQDYRNHPQGASNATFSSWIRFKRSPLTGFDFIGNKNSSIDENDKKTVSELREWLNTNPCLEALYEARISTPIAHTANTNTTRTTTTTTSNDNLTTDNRNEEISENELNSAASKMNMQPPDVEATINFRSKPAKLITLSQIPLEGFFDTVVQVLALGVSNGRNFMFVWDGTKSKYAILQENEFVLESSAAAATSSDATNNTAYFSKSILEYMVQVFVFDEYVECLKNIQAGDFVLLKNCRTNKPGTNSTADVVFRMPGSGQGFGRTILRLAGVDGGANSPISEFVSPAITAILEKSKEYDLKFVAADEMSAELRSKLLQPGNIDDSLDEFLLAKKLKEVENLAKPNNNNNNKNNGELNNEKQPPNVKRKSLAIDMLWKDQESMYCSDSDEEKSVENVGDGDFEDGEKCVTSKNVPQPLDKEATKEAVNDENQQPAETENLNEKQREAENVSSLAPKVSPKKRALVDTTNENNASILTSNKDLEMNQDSNNNNNNNNEDAINVNNGEEVEETEAQSVEKFKKNKLIDTYEICTEIFKSKRLSNLTYLVPYVNSNSLASSKYEKSMPFFTSLHNLASAAVEHSSLRCKVIAKLFNYSISSCPHIASVFVACKKCNYINFAPFHLANIHQSGHLSMILADLKTQPQFNMESQMTQMTQMTQSSQNYGDFVGSRKNCAKNFSIEWLCTALPSGICAPLEQTQPEADSAEVPIMSYECPRCLFLASKTGEFASQSPNSTVDYLEYMYRFWFVLGDANSKLTPCLFEDAVAHKFLGNITAVEFYTNTRKAHQVYKTIHKNFEKKYLFTVETCRLSEMSCGALNPRKVDVMYKIVGFDEIAQ